jgi:hypothetical protein
MSDPVRRVPRLLTLLFFVAFFNWFVNAFVHAYLGGDAMRTLPSRDGFVLSSHGRHTPVSESVWLFSLIYTGATLMLSPAIGISFFGWTFHVSGELWKINKWGKWMIAGFILVWTLGWYSSVGSSFYQSINDWSELKRAPGGR